MFNYLNFIFKKRISKFNVKIFSFLLIVIFLMIIFCIFIIKCKFITYINLIGIVRKDKVVLLVLKDDIKLVSNNSKLFLNKKEYYYKIDFISEYKFNEKGNYVEIFVDVLIPDKYKINNNLIDIKIISKEENLFNYIKLFLIGGD